MSTRFSLSQRATLTNSEKINFYSMRQKTPKITKIGKINTLTKNYYYKKVNHVVTHNYKINDHIYIILLEHKLILFIYHLKIIL